MKTNTKSYGNSFCLTLFLTGLYMALHHLPIPTMANVFSWDPDWFGKYMEKTNVLALGFKPALSGFIVVEVLSLVLPPLNRWRLEGKAGREKINRWAWYVSFFFCFINAFGTTYFLKRIEGAHMEGAFLPFQALTILTLVGGFSFSVFLARVITQYGVGNGFLILALVENISSQVLSTSYYFKKYLAANPVGEQNFLILVMVLILAAFAVYLWHLLRHPPRFPLHSPGGKLIWFEVPPFPSGAYLQGFVLTSITTLSVVLGKIHFSNAWLREGWTQQILEMAMMALLGVLAYNWFWGIDLFGIDVAGLPRQFQKREKLLDRQLGRTLPLLLFGALLFWLPIGPDKFRSIYWILSFLELLYCLGLLQDLLDQGRFWGIHGPGVEVLEMDNMILASYLKGLLEAEKIPCHFQGYHFRLLMLWFKPLFKVRLLVPEDQKEKAIQLINQVPYKVV